MESVAHINHIPESFTAYLQKTVDFVENRPDQPRMILINAWNEWVEGSYLEPDMNINISLPNIPLSWDCIIAVNAVS